MKTANGTRTMDDVLNADFRTAPTPQEVEQWRQERTALESQLAESQRQNDDYQMRLANLRRGLEHVGNAPDWETALKYVHAALVHDIHDGFATFYFEQLEIKLAESQRRESLLRPLVVEWAYDEYGQFCVHCNAMKLDSTDSHEADCPYKVALENGAMGSENEIR